jgi:hypothetical protein
VDCIRSSALRGFPFMAEVAPQACIRDHWSVRNYGVPSVRLVSRRGRSVANHRIELHPGICTRSLVVRDGHELRQPLRLLSVVGGGWK